MKCSQCDEYVTHVHVFHQQAHCTNCKENITTEVKEHIARQSKLIKIIITLGSIAILLMLLMAAIYQEGLL